MNQKISELLKLKEKDIDQVNKVYALNILEVLKTELKSFNLKNQDIIIEYSMGGVFLTVNGKDFQRSRHSNKWREKTWHKHAMFNSWKKLMEILKFLDNEENSSWSFHLDKQSLTKKTKENNE